MFCYEPSWLKFLSYGGSPHIFFEHAGPYIHRSCAPAVLPAPCLVLAAGGFPHRPPLQQTRGVVCSFHDGSARWECNVECNVDIFFGLKKFTGITFLSLILPPTQCQHREAHGSKVRSSRGKTLFETRKRVFAKNFVPVTIPNLKLSKKGSGQPRRPRGSQGGPGVQGTEFARENVF